MIRRNITICLWCDTMPRFLEGQSLIVEKGPLGAGRLSPVQAAAFARQDVEERRHQAVRGMVLGLCCYLGLLAIDWWLVPDVARLNAMLRLYVGMPVGAAATRLLTRPGLSPAAYQLLPIVFGLTCAVTIAFAMSRSAEPAALTYVCAGLVVISFTINLVGLTPGYAAGVNVAIAVVMAAFTAQSRYGSASVSATYLVFGLMVGGVATYANWSLLNQRRRAFLLRERDRERLAEIARQRDLLERLAMIDPLTGLPNRRGFDAVVAADLSRTGPDTAVAAMMVDVDCFKAFNDAYGHPSGDEALRSVAQVLAAALAEDCTDARLARVGGEEFAAVLLGRDPGRAVAIAERLRRAVEDAALTHAHGSVGPVVTVSIGVAHGRTGMGQGDCAALLAAADGALYEAKRRGRNRVAAAERHGPAPGAAAPRVGMGMAYRG